MYATASLLPNYAYFSTWLHLFQVSTIGLFLLMVGIFFPKSGEFTRFLNRLGFGYLLLNLWETTGGVVLRPSGVNAEAQELLEWMQSDSLLSHLFAFYASLAMALFLYGVADRFFIANSAEIEFPILLFFIHIASLLTLRLTTFPDLLIALEIVTLASYALAGFERRNRFSAYAGVQYFILGSIPSGMLLLSFSLYYRHGGVMTLHDLDLITLHPDLNREIRPTILFSREMLYELARMDASPWFVRDRVHPICLDDPDWEMLFTVSSPYAFTVVAGAFLLLFNLLFKITAAPFHFWAPSVYGKSPIASVTYLSIFSKVLILFFIFRVLFTFLHPLEYVVGPVLLVISLLSVLIGMIGAFVENVIKRFYVYSSMGHVGFMLLGLSLGTLEGATATFHYLAIYVLSSYLMWLLLLHMGRDKNHLIHFKELKDTDPLLGFVFALLVFSMSGIPPLGGFFVKLDILNALLDESRFYANYLLFIFTVASFFYYLRLIKILFFDATLGEHTFNKPSHGGFGRSTERLWVMVVCFILLAFYLFLVQKPLLAIQGEALAALL